MKKKRIVYMASAQIALPVLHQLANSAFDVVCIYTKPPQASGRGQLRHPTSINQTANHYQIPVYTPVSFDDPHILQTFKDLRPDLVLVFAYGMILPEKLLSCMPHRFLNFHASLLPKWRGAAPIERAIAQGETETGITLMEITEKLDAGDTLTSWHTPIPASATALEMRERIGNLAACHVVEALTQFFEEKFTPTPQDSTLATYAPKLLKHESPIDFSQNAQTIVNKCRAFHPFPVCTAKIAGQTIKIWQAEVHPKATDASFGTILDPKNCIVACGENSTIKFLALQRSGKNIVKGYNFLQQFKPLPTKIC